MRSVEFNDGVTTVTVSDNPNAEVVRKWADVKPTLHRLELALGKDGPTGAQAIQGFIFALQDNLDDREECTQIIRMAATYSSWMARNQAIEALEEAAEEAFPSGERSDATA